ncbi:MAG: dihydroxyacetone kinase phosphoryl donor subunit DhaM, partial [Pygmaiobacter massiliensis]
AGGAWLMVGIVLISHSGAVAQSVAGLAKMMAPEARVTFAGGLPDGSFGTSYDALYEAVRQADDGDGAVLLMDMGIAVMTAEMVQEALPQTQLLLADAPFVEGAIAATLTAGFGASAEEVLAAAEAVRGEQKLN